MVVLFSIEVAWLFGVDVSIVDGEWKILSCEVGDGADEGEGEVRGGVVVAFVV